MKELILKFSVSTIPNIQISFKSIMNKIRSRKRNKFNKKIKPNNWKIWAKVRFSNNNILSKNNLILFLNFNRDTHPKALTMLNLSLMFTKMDISLIKKIIDSNQIYLIQNQLLMKILLLNKPNILKINSKNNWIKIFFLKINNR